MVRWPESLQGAQGRVFRAADRVESLTAQRPDVQRSHRCRPAVQTDVAVISHHKKLARRHGQGTKLALFRQHWPGMEDVRFVEELAIEEDLTVMPFNSLAALRVNPLDHELSLRVHQDGNVAISWRVFLVVAPIHDDAVTHHYAIFHRA